MPIRLLFTRARPTTKRPWERRRVAAALASAEVDINHVDMGEEEAQDATDLRFIITVRDRSHLELALQKLKRIPAVLRALRIKPASFPS